MYQIRISPEAKGQLKTVKRLYKTALTSALNDLGEDPFVGKPLTRELTGRISLRTVQVISAGHRSTIYN